MIIFLILSTIADVKEVNREFTCVKSICTAFNV